MTTLATNPAKMENIDSINNKQTDKTTLQQHQQWTINQLLALDKQAKQSHYQGISSEQAKAEIFAHITRNRQAV